MTSLPHLLSKSSQIYSFAQKIVANNIDIRKMAKAKKYRNRSYKQLLSDKRDSARPFHGHPNQAAYI